MFFYNIKKGYPVALEPGRIAPRPSIENQSFLQRRMPGLYALRGYKKTWLKNDIAAGVVLASMLIPVGIAYSVAAGLPGINGLYASIIPLLVYALFGPSRFLVMGPDSTLAGVILAVILPLSEGDPVRAVTLAGVMAIFSGLICILAAVARLGFVTDLFSKPIRYGYMNGIALTVLLSQLPSFFGFSANGNSPLTKLTAFSQALLDGQTNWVALTISLSASVIIWIFRKSKRFPGTLVVVIAATILTGLLGLEQYGVEILGTLPQGLPTFVLPWVRYEDLYPLLTGALAISLLSFSETSLLSRSYAAKYETYIDSNKEMFGLGVANLTTGLFQGFPISSSFSRTPVAEAAGAKSQLTGVVGALTVAGLLIFAPTLLETLPTPVLAAVVVTSILGLFEITDLHRIYRIQRWEFWLSVGCAVGVVVLGAVPGIGFAIVIAIIEFLWDAWRPHSAVLGRVNGLKGYHDRKRYPDSKQIPGLVLFRWDAPLFFANAELFHEIALDAVADSPTPVRWLVVAAEPVTSVDVTAADMLLELDKALRKSQIELRFAEMKDPVKDKLKRFGLFARFGKDFFFPTVGEAVNTYLKTYSVDWTDWEDEKNKPSPNID